MAPGTVASGSIAARRDMMDGSASHCPRTMTGSTVAAMGRHGVGIAVSRLQGAVCIVAGGAGIMDQVIASVNRHAGYGAAGGGMTDRTTVVVSDDGAVVGDQSYRSIVMATSAVASGSIAARRDMMDGAASQIQFGDVAINAGRLIGGSNGATVNAIERIAILARTAAC